MDLRAHFLASLRAFIGYLERKIDIKSSRDLRVLRGI